MLSPSYYAFPRSSSNIPGTGMLLIPEVRILPQHQAHNHTPPPSSSPKPQDALFYIGTIEFPNRMVARPQLLDGEANFTAPGGDSWYFDIATRRTGFPCCGMRFGTVKVYAEHMDAVHEVEGYIC
ncbi:hypothetical protein ONS95_003483 [Cadophora gregata]|uniref:uncharacterized protein n=1 Tax=Cadophora gregata TaxID=51156 RepID=UPI0026DC48B1|nr:uncharacterized protein ONS95_003483 [Cadophora gregata]KAK0108691.1 hypothetical protein ONS95_003483 [Cadophora gregata]KAK0108718.1 hypothetical protein ONS96_002565 [Cadophora gregata f. sp. sojae]